MSGARRLLCRHGVNSRGRNVNRTFYLDLFLSLRHVSAQSFRWSRLSSVILELQNFAVDIRAIIDSGLCLTMFFQHSTVTSDPLTSDPVYMSCKGHVGFDGHLPGESLLVGCYVLQRAAMLALHGALQALC